MFKVLKDGQVSIIGRRPDLDQRMQSIPNMKFETQDMVVLNKTEIVELIGYLVAVYLRAGPKARISKNVLDNRQKL